MDRDLSETTAQAKWHRLTDVKCRTETKPGKYADSPNLILRIGPCVTDQRRQSKSWSFRYTRDGIKRMLGLGAYPAVSLAQARRLATAMREQLARGLDPKGERGKERAQRRLDAARRLTFRDAAKQLIADRSAGWSNEQHAKDFANSLDTYAMPIIGNMVLADIGTEDVLRVLTADDFWNEKPVTADRVRSRIEMVLGWGTVRGYRSGDNPAVWRSHLEMILPKPGDIKPRKHHPALDYSEMPAFMTALRDRNGLVPRALEFEILTASRIAMVIGKRKGEGMQAREVDFARRVWTVPGLRMKAKKADKVAADFVIPLSDRAIAILRERIAEVGVDSDAPLFGTHRATVSKFIREDLKLAGKATAHGNSRASSRSWIMDATNFADDIGEAMLAHTVKGQSRQAYMRGARLEKRRKLMAAWDRYLSGATTVTPLQRVG